MLQLNGDQRENFKAGLRPFWGKIKGVLTRGDFVAGIGNAYADEVLWAAQLAEPAEHMRSCARNGS